MNQNIRKISDSEWMVIFDKVMKKLNLYKIYSYQYNTSWYHYKFKNTEEIYDVCKEMFEIFIEDIQSHEVDDNMPITSAGFNIFIRNDKLYILYENRQDKNHILSTNDKDCVEVASVNCLDVLRRKKLEKICLRLERK